MPPPIRSVSGPVILVSCQTKSGSRPREMYQSGTITCCFVILGSKSKRARWKGTLQTLNQEIARSIASQLTSMWDFVRTSKTLFFNLWECDASWCFFMSSQQFVRIAEMLNKSAGNSCRQFGHSRAEQRCLLWCNDEGLSTTERRVSSFWLIDKLNYLAPATIWHFWWDSHL